MQRTLAVAVIFLLTSAGLNAGQVKASTRESSAKMKLSERETKQLTAVRAVLEAQAAAWNRGDVEGYMDGYARTDETTFVSGDNITRGWQTVLARYRKNYDTREKMGQLSFSDLDIKFIGKDTAVVLGRWQLTRAQDTPHGRFTLIFRHTKVGWRIIHDHTS